MARGLIQSLRKRRWAVPTLFDKGTPIMLLIGTDEGIYRWTEGNNWPVFHSLQECSVVGLASPGAGFLAVLDSTGKVWESGNNGQVWREVVLPEGVGRPTAIAVGGTPASILLAGSGLGHYRRMMGSTARTASPIEFVRQATPVLINRARSIVGGKRGDTLSAVSPSKRTANLNGWTKLGTPKMVKSPTVNSLASIPGAWFSAVAGEGLWRSGDDGANWMRCEALPATVHAIRPVPGQPGQLYAATSEGVKFSNDAGKIWEDRSKGLEAVKFVRAIEVCSDDPSYLLAGAAPAATGGGYGLYESKDAGKTWARVLRSFPENMQSDPIVDIRFDPTQPTRAAVAFESGEMWMTLTGGDYWQPFARDIRSVRVLCRIG